MEGHALSSFQNYWRLLSRDFQRIVWVEHRKGWFSPIKNIAEKIDCRPGCTDVGNENTATDFFVGNKLKRFALHKIVKASWMPDGYLTNDDQGPLRRNELVASKVNGLLRKHALVDARCGQYDSKNCEHPSEQIDRVAHRPLPEGYALWLVGWASAIGLGLSVAGGWLLGAFRK
jgi:hypothetical protein